MATTTSAGTSLHDEKRRPKILMCDPSLNVYANRISSGSSRPFVSERPCREDLEWEGFEPLGKGFLFTRHLADLARWTRDLAMARVNR